MRTLLLCTVLTAGVVATALAVVVGSLFIYSLASAEELSLTLTLIGTALVVTVWLVILLIWLLATGVL